MDSFSLNTEPFENTLDRRFFYGGTTLMQRLDLLSHLTQFGDSVILVSGPAGSGKSTLLDRFISQAGSQWHLCVLNGDEFARFPECLAGTLKSAAPASEQELFNDWAARTDNSQLLVIVIDAAEQLGEDAFERLCALLESGHANRVRLILFGSPEAQQQHRQALEQRQLPFTTQLLEMPRMSEEETAAYLTYRLAVAGYSGENPFTATEIRAICKASDGRPAAINRLARQALLEHQARAGSKRVRRRKLPRKTGTLLPVLGIAAVLVVATWLGWQRFYPPVTEQMPVARIPMEERPLALPEPAPLVPPTPPATPAAPPARQESAPTGTAPDRPETGTRPLTEVAADLDAPEAAPATRASPVEPQPAPGTDHRPLPVPAEAQRGAAGQTLSPVPAPAADASAHREQAVEPPAAAAIPVIPVAEEHGTAPAAPAGTPPAAATDHSPTPETGMEPATAEPLPHRERWLMQQAETAYTLQLLGSRNAESIHQYLEQHHLDTHQAAVYKGLYKDADWYVLLYGIYPSRQAAIDARATLPAAIRKDQPWPRTLKSVHNAIRAIQ